MTETCDRTKLHKFYKTHDVQIFINGTHLSSLLCELLETDERDLHHERATHAML